ncbi:hypothetical protein HDZ31DRAFT_85926 [Schizophyllum fasciatum]
MAGSAGVLRKQPARIFTVFGKFWLRPHFHARRARCPSPLARCVPEGAARPPRARAPRLHLRARAAPTPPRAPKPTCVLLQRHRARDDTHLPDRLRGGVVRAQGLHLLHSSLEHEQASDKALVRIAELEAEVDRLQAEHSVRGAGTNSSAGRGGGSAAWWKLW